MLKTSAIMDWPVASINQESNTGLEDPNGWISTDALYDHILSNSTQSVKDKLVNTVPLHVLPWYDAAITVTNRKTKHTAHLRISCLSFITQIIKMKNLSHFVNSLRTEIANIGCQFNTINKDYGKLTCKANISQFLSGHLLVSVHTVQAWLFLVQDGSTLSPSKNCL